MRVITPADTGATFEKAELSHWFVAEGSVVAAQDELAECADSKNVYVLRAPARMRVARIVAAKGSAVTSATVICEGDDL